jgi:hypothetical protein
MLHAVLAALLLALPAGAQGAAGLRVTTDSAAYCAELAERVAGMPRGAAEPARSLAEEGRRLCETGHVRSGIARLRRAIRQAQTIPS